MQGDLDGRPQALLVEGLDEVAVDARLVHAKPRGVVGVGHVHDAGERRNLLALELVRIASSIPSLVVMLNDVKNVFHALDAANNQCTKSRVSLQDFKFF